jgi:hypothetical protein
MRGAIGWQPLAHPYPGARFYNGVKERIRPRVEAIESVNVG